ncbi:immune inhibitor A domain-containing protein [Pseudalkalibacillus berkeleyi]|uniref:Immune inhibitor A n=1 Tax=Pseudalkalibacillus berkeleyi TaxID=1069813 RepID=A0ABS9GY13_9BACL|nr:immune inhibitor A domain-containing protein [Pseudalkalibacillus berkeleyi]MCF6137614.1 immune inhibitor A [Pseudalkalibacillus berkeleyi]
MKTWKSTIGVFIIGLGLFLGTFSPSASAAINHEMQLPDLNKPGPIDLGIINDERLIQSLINRGEISIVLSAKGKEKALKDYLEKRASEQWKTIKTGGKLGAHNYDTFKSSRDLLRNGMKTQLLKNETLSNYQKIPSLYKEKWTGSTRSDRVLVIAIDFPDYSTGKITPDDTDMYYDQYPIEHYRKMIFGEEGYTGPNGENLISMKQYYELQSGKSYTVTGQVAGWYTASKPAAYYGQNVPDSEGNDARPRSLVAEAITLAAEDPKVNLNDYDIEDRYDLDGDGNYREPDGLIDHLMIIHAGSGEEAGGGSLGEAAIWSHRWNLGGVFAIPGTEAEVPYWNGALGVFDYTMEPEDGATGVFAHEYAHDLGLPDEYDTQYTGEGEPVAYWSLMSSGSWAGKIPGTEPTGFSAWSKEFLQTFVGGNWLTGLTIDSTDPSFQGKLVILDQASGKGIWNDAVKVKLPDKVNVVNEPYSGMYEYHSGRGNSIDHSMSKTIDLSQANQAMLTFKTWYEIEEGWDYASVQVKEIGATEWETVEGNLTTTEDPNNQNPGNGITGFSDGWVEGQFDLSQYSGKTIELRLNYWTDVAAVEKGFYLDDLSIHIDGKQTVFDDAEGNVLFKLDGFVKDEGTYHSIHYYLLEWRNHQGVDIGLKHILRGDSLMEYDEGLVVWYVDYSYTDNWTGDHPGDGFLGVVDAHQSTLRWSDGSIASTKYQVNDAAFGISQPNDEFLDYRETLGITLTSNGLKGDRMFTDIDNYMNTGLPDAGRNIPGYGLNFIVFTQSNDQSTALIGIFKVK